MNNKTIATKLSKLTVKQLLAYSTAMTTAAEKEKLIDEKAFDKMIRVIKKKIKG